MALDAMTPREYKYFTRKDIERGEFRLHHGGNQATCETTPPLARPRVAGAGPEARHRALALAAQHGHVEVVRLLLDAGEDPNRYNPEGNHAHSTPLHQAALAGHEPVVRLLVERGAWLDIKDTIYQATPLGWAWYAGQTAIAAYLEPPE